MPRRHLIALSLIASLVAAACQGGMSDERAGPPVSISAQDATTISSYFSPYAYGQTIVLVEVPDEAAVLKLTFPNESKTLSVSGKLVLFEDGTSGEMIDAWKNNQYSDAIMPAPEPVETVALGKRVEIVSSEMTGEERARGDQLYHNYDVIYRVQEIPTERFTLSGFQAQTTVHVMMEGKRPSM